jgi:hypothetical protein
LRAPTHTHTKQIHTNLKNLEAISQESRKWLLKNWVNPGMLSGAYLLAASPVDDLCAYFGEEVAFRFSFIQHYNRWLLILSAFGSLAFAVQIGLAKATLDSSALLYYTVLLTMWSTLMVEAWIRKQKTLEYIWGLSCLEDEDDIRPQFNGVPQYNLWTGRTELCETTQHRIRRSFEVVFLLVSWVAIFAFQVNLTLYNGYFKVNNSGWMDLGIMSTQVITFVVQETLAGACHSLSIKLTDFEDWRTQDNHAAALGFKFVAYQLFNYYLVLLLTAFYGSNGAPCIASSPQHLEAFQCLELESTGFPVPQPGCIALINPAYSSGSASRERSVLVSNITHTISSMGPEQLSDPKYKCLEGTTMKIFFQTFLILFSFRLGLGYLFSYCLSPLAVWWGNVKENIWLRVKVSRNAMERLERAKLLMNQVNKDKIHDIREVAPNSAQASLNRKLDEIRNKEESEHERIFEMTRTPGFLGFLHRLFAHLEESRRKTFESELSKTAYSKSAEEDKAMISIQTSTEPLVSCKADKKQREMATAFKTLSFDISEAGREMKLNTDSNWYAFSDILIQFGYICYFSQSFPVAPLMAWIYNINNVRLDAEHLCHKCVRPLIVRVKGIKFWIEAVGFIVYTGLVLNLLMLALCSYAIRMFQAEWLGSPDPQSLNTRSYFLHMPEEDSQPITNSSAAVSGAVEQEEWGLLSKMSERGRDFSNRTNVVWVMFFMEHIVFFIKVGISLVISDVPGWVGEAQKGIMQFRRKKRLENAFKAMVEESEAESRFNIIGKLSGEHALDQQAAVATGDIEKVKIYKYIL